LYVCKLLPCSVNETQNTSVSMHWAKQQCCTPKYKLCNTSILQCFFFWMRRPVALQMGTNVSKEPAAVIIRAEELLRYLKRQQNIGEVRRKKSIFPNLYISNKPHKMAGTFTLVLSRRRQQVSPQHQ